MIPLPLILGGIVAAFAVIDRHEKAGKESNARISETGVDRDGGSGRRQPRSADQSRRQSVRKKTTKPAVKADDPPKEKPGEETPPLTADEPAKE